MQTPGRVFWITGLSAAGKTSIGRALSAHLRASGSRVIFLDGDTLRAAVSNDLGYSAENRRAAAMRNGMLCRMLAEQGFDVVCSTISLFHDVQRWNRENIPRYNEIFVRVPLEELKRRDTKGIYAGWPAGKWQILSGSTFRPRLPKRPDLILDNRRFAGARGGSAADSGPGAAGWSASARPQIRRGPIWHQG